MKNVILILLAGLWLFFLTQEILRYVSLAVLIAGAMFFMSQKQRAIMAACILILLLIILAFQGLQGLSPCSAWGDTSTSQSCGSDALPPVE